MSIQTLLVDTNRAAVPIYHALQDMGHEVWVVGNKPDDTLAKLAANYIQLDYSDSKRLAALVDDRNFDYLIPGCTDLSYRVCAEINRDRFPCIDTPSATTSLNNKSAFRRLATDLGVPVPRTVSPQQAVDLEAVIVKPVDSFSGRGMTVVHDVTSGKLEQAQCAARDASMSGEVILQEYISGQLYSHSAFLSAGEVVADFIVQEDCTVNPFTVDLSRVVESFPSEIVESLRADIGRLSSALALSNGLIHTQFICHENRYWIIEITRRCPGDIYSLLIELSTGYPYAASYAASFVGDTPLPREENDFFERITRHTVSNKRGAKLWGYQFSAPVDIRLFVPLATSGDFIEPSPYGRAGIFFFHSSTCEEQQRLYQKIQNASLYRFS